MGIDRFTNYDHIGVFEHYSISEKADFVKFRLNHRRKKVPFSTLNILTNRAVMVLTNLQKGL